MKKHNLGWMGLLAVLTSILALCAVDCGGSGGGGGGGGGNGGGGAITTCGNAACDATENHATCPADCVLPTCGNGDCDASETHSVCPVDCTIPTCGNVICNAEETHATCPADCKMTTCGNGACDLKENHFTCPADCPIVTCGNGVCDAGETNATCPIECLCGNGACDASENHATCPVDCTIATCGNGTCDLGEIHSTCPADCAITTCGNGFCDAGETHATCPADCLCGNGVCDAGETYATCPADCLCGNGACDAGETHATCPVDCLCGNGVCDICETHAGCPADCAVATCGNGTCDAGETNASCPTDCIPPEMALIPSGCFEMGDAFNEGDSFELPVHHVCITRCFFIDAHQVTNAEYAACVSAGGCVPPSEIKSYKTAFYYGNPTYNDFPVLYVTWNKALAYCTWAGKRLPTEAEWEYAARGGLSGKRYPWGDSISGANANFYFSGDPWDNDTTPVEYYPPNGYGLYDMVGNVGSWVNDFYASDYYSHSPINNPRGPVSSITRVQRGSLFWSDPIYLRLSSRGGCGPGDEGFWNSIRCAAD